MLPGLANPFGVRSLDSVSTFLWGEHVKESVAIPPWLPPLMHRLVRNVGAHIMSEDVLLPRADLGLLLRGSKPQSGTETSARGGTETINGP